MDSHIFEHILLRRRQDVLFATLNRPDTRHALAPEVVAELARVLDLAENDGAVRALVLRGSRGFFCAGGNVGNFQSRLDAEATPGDDPVAGHRATTTDTLATKNTTAHFLHIKVRESRQIRTRCK